MACSLVLSTSQVRQLAEEIKDRVQVYIESRIQSLRRIKNQL